jgi:hypothetical protein
MYRFVRRPIKGSDAPVISLSGGNFIECTSATILPGSASTPNGKPVLDRAMHYDVELYEALKTSDLDGFDDAFNLGVRSADRRAGRYFGVTTPISITASRRASRIFTIRSLVGGAARGASEYSRPPYKTESVPKKRKQAKQNDRVKNKIAVVTGAGTGVGRAASLALMNAGFTVVLAGRRMEMLEEKARDNIGKNLCVSADMTDPARSPRCSPR